MVEPKKKPGIKVRNTPPFKLKDRVNNPQRRFQFIHLKNQFGFIPETIIVEKVWGSNNKIIVRAVMTEAELKKEKALKKKMTKEEMLKKRNMALKKRGGEK